MEVYRHSFLTLVLRGGEWLALRLGRFAPGQEPLESIVRTAGRDPETVWILWGRRQVQKAPSAMYSTDCLSERRMSHGTLCMYVHCRPQQTHGLTCPRTFWRNANAEQHYVHISCQNVTPVGHEVRTVRYKFAHVPQYNLSVQTFKKLKLAAQRFANNSDTKFHKILRTVW